MDMNEIKEIFFQECEEQLAELESGLLAINDGDTDLETVNAVFRAVHSIKGGAGAFGLDDLVAFAHVFETTLDCVRSDKIETSPELLKVMLKSADVLADLTAAARDGSSLDPVTHHPVWLLSLKHSPRGNRCLRPVLHPQPLRNLSLHLPKKPHRLPLKLRHLPTRAGLNRFLSVLMSLATRKTRRVRG
jgi:HPt (histidine-containing phosphotransfer) domain-containing protein